MDFARLEEFEAVARYGTIKKAAQSLGISSATLSARLIRFEEQIGAALFVRANGSFHLTPAGEQLRPYSTELLSNFKKVHKEMLSAEDHDYHQLRIAVCGSELPLYLGPFLDKLNLNSPDIRLEILDDSRYSIQDGLLSGDIDIYFAPVMQDFRPQRLVHTQISIANPHVILPQTHPLSGRIMISMRELDGETFLLYPHTQEPAIREFQIRNLEDSGIHYQTYDSETPSQFYMLLVPVGKGIVLHPSHLMGLPPYSVSVPVTDLPHHASISYFFSKTTSNPDVRAFCRDFTAFAKELSAHEHKQTL